jgi:hypothetical protein
MSKLTKALLVLSVIGFATGFVFVTGLVKIGDAVALYAALPMGAIFFGLFLISKMLEKEITRHDKEVQAALDSAARINARKLAGRKACCEEPTHSHGKSLASAH